MPANARAEMGRLIQKIQRHETASVKTPPRRGPKMELRPNTAPVSDCRKEKTRINQLLRPSPFASAHILLLT